MVQVLENVRRRRENQKSRLQTSDGPEPHGGQAGHPMSDAQAAGKEAVQHEKLRDRKRQTAHQRHQQHVHTTRPEKEQNHRESRRCRHSFYRDHGQDQVSG